MRKSQFIFVLMLGCSLAAMAKAGTSKDNCEHVAGEGNCHAILNNLYFETEGYSDTTYYALSGPEGNKTMTIYGTTESGNTAATVPTYAFFDYEFQKSTIPEGVTSLKTFGNVDIGDGAFQGATSLTSVDLTGVQSIGYSAFQDATGLTSVDLTGVQRLASGAFENATGLKSVVISDSLLGDDGKILSWEYDEESDVSTGVAPNAFFLSGLKTIYCPEGKICGNYFYGFPGGTPKVIPYSIENGQIKAGGKTYASLDDLASGNYIVKRIYTIDEANAVAGKVNSVKIRYR